MPEPKPCHLSTIAHYLSKCENWPFQKWNKKKCEKYVPTYHYFSKANHIRSHIYNIHYTK